MAPSRTSPDASGPAGLGRFCCAVVPRGNRPLTRLKSHSLSSSVFGSAFSRKPSRRESRLRFEMLNAFVDTGMADLSRAELAVWLILYRDTQRNGVARASLDDLARRWE